MKGIIYRIIPEDLTTVTEFEIGNLDVITIPASEYSRYKNHPKRQGLISSIKGPNTYYLGLNCSKPPFNNLILRKAMNYAIDREKIPNTINKGEPDMFYLSWWADYPDPENFLFPLFHSSNHGAGGNRTRYKNLTVDSLIEKGQHALNQKMRDLYYRQAEKIIVKEVPWVFFWHRTDFAIRQPWIKNYKIYPIYSMDKGVEVSF